ncbi:MAG TPA: metal-dependent hydrolase [Polyangiaceae bacterium LLY-WYZ-15_(1-7)]|nr:metal-dependent hydrolase [Myxococcales bacterium]MAT28000.1 metal-dependent hydrolase [Sandaracinus sp.]HJK91279.1 metal-dependent hydrolase [Polyangiaceae bacterium LLY-WYZ-15_(1-7)]MBJ70971.1 metal-dependent hydrolase [Sandaracinus sp.]HJL02794.1 metal-dependent hydrolase [Polyangiaceae bacterium LLY-WYZ-15_(1-7)]
MIEASSRHPHDEPIAVRRMDFTFDESTPTCWFDDNPYLTAIMTALAVSFPPGERYFIRSVRHFLDQVDDPALREAVRAFVGQEANHTKEHLAFNRFLDSRGLPATPMEEWVTRRVERIQEVSGPAGNLARTAALEHFTAILAEALLAHPEITEKMSPEVARLWVWHAIEEVEHRSVAFDVYEEAVGDEALRLRVMAFVTVIFIAMNVARAAILLRATGRVFEPRAALKALNVLWGKPGLFRKVIPQYLRYYRRGFHPSEHDNRELVRRAKARWLGGPKAAAA